MNKKLRITLDIITILIGMIFLFWGIKDAYSLYKNSKVDDNVKFAHSYTSVSKDNIYKYASLKDVNKLLKSDNAVIIFGKTTDPWMQVLVAPLESICKEYVDVIYYLELDNIDFSDKEYKSVLEKVGSLSSPEVIFIKSSKIAETLEKSDIYDENFEGAPIEYFDKNNLATFNDKIKENLK